MDCAWCMVEQGIELGDGSHGICTDHAEEQWQKYQASKADSESSDNQEQEEEYTVAA